MVYSTTSCSWEFCTPKQIPSSAYWYKMLIGAEELADISSYQTFWADNNSKSYETSTKLIKKVGCAHRGKAVKQQTVKRGFAPTGLMQELNGTYEAIDFVPVLVHIVPHWMITSPVRFSSHPTCTISLLCNHDTPSKTGGGHPKPIARDSNWCTSKTWWDWWAIDNSRRCSVPVL